MINQLRLDSAVDHLNVGDMIKNAMLVFHSHMVAVKATKIISLRKELASIIARNLALERVSNFKLIFKIINKLCILKVLV